MIILAFTLLVLVGAVSFINTEPMLINLYFTTLSVPEWIVFVIFLLIGMLIAALFATSKGSRNRQVIKNKDQEIKRAKEEKTEAIKRIQEEKEEAVERVKLEKEETVERLKKESDLQLELQNREAEIKKLQSQLAKDDESTLKTEKVHIQNEMKDTPIEEQYPEQDSEKETITAYKTKSEDEN